MKWLLIIGALAIAGCTSGIGNTGLQGTLNTPWADLQGVPTLAPDGMAPMGYRLGIDGEEDMYTTFSNGAITATGRAAYAMALSYLCAVAPLSPLCGE